MIVGTGLIATAMHERSFPDRFCLFAAGVSNSSCTDASEFEREKQRLLEASAQLTPSTTLVYFSTCSIFDPQAAGSGYVKHKLQMEQIVAERGKHVVFRLPQVAGRTPNPHTILNYLYAKIARSEKFVLWKNSSRNILDVDDISRIVLSILLDESALNETITLAHPESSSIGTIVAEFERITGKVAVFDAVSRGSEFSLDSARTADTALRCGIELEGDYLSRVLDKYYGRHRSPN